MAIQDSQELKPLQKKRSDSPINKTQAIFTTSVQNILYLSAYLNISIIYNEYEFSQWSQELARSSSLIQLALAAEDSQQATKATYSLPKMRTPDSTCQYFRSYSYQSVHLHTHLQSSTSFHKTPLGTVGPSPHERDTKSNFKQMALTVHLGCLTREFGFLLQESQYNII